MKAFVRLVICCLLATWQVHCLLRPGLIYRQDWAWPVTLQQLLAARWLNQAPWNANGLGAAAIAPLHHPLFLIWSFFGVIVGPHWTLLITLVTALAAFGCGVASCIGRLWRLPEYIILPAGLVAQSGIPIFNKLVAGHTYYLIAMAALVWVVRAVSGGSRRPVAALISAGVLAAFAVIQIQLYVIAFLAVLGAAVWKRSLHWVFRSAVVGLVAIQLAPLVLAVIEKDAPAAYEVMRPQLFWELNNSAPFPKGLLLLGYSPHYAEHAIAIARSGFFVMPLLALGVFAALVGAVARFRRMASWLILGAWLLFTLLVLGFFGPLAPILGFLFSRFPAFGIFRELYHFAAPAWAAEVILIAGLAVSRMSRRATAVLLSLLLFALMSVWAPADFGGALAPVAVPRSLTKSLEAVRRTPGDARFLLWPAEWPVGPKGSDASGNDPAAYPVGAHPVANQFRLSGPLEIAAGLVREGKAQAAKKWFRAAGVSLIVSEPWLREDLSGRAPPLNSIPNWMHKMLSNAKAGPPPLSLSPTCLLCAYTRLPVVVNEQDWRTREGDAFVTASALYTRASQVCKIKLPFDQAVDPGEGWKSIADWSWLDSRLAMFGPGVFSWSSQPLSVGPCGQGAYAVKVLALRGDVLVDGRIRKVSIGYPAQLRLTPGRHILRVRKGILAVGSVIAGPRHAHRPSPRFERAASSLLFSWKTGIGDGRIPADTRWIVLKTTYSPKWRLSLKGGSVVSHFVASGYANGWRVRAGPQGADLHLWYEPWAAAEWFAIAGALSWWLALLALIGLALLHPARAVAQFRKFR